MQMSYIMEVTGIRRVLRVFIYLRLGLEKSHFNEVGIFQELLRKFVEDKVLKSLESKKLHLYLRYLNTMGRQKMSIM